MGARARTTSRRTAALAAGCLASLALAGFALSCVSVTGAVGAPPADRVVAQSRTAPPPSPTRLTVVSHNIEKRPVALERAVGAARRSGAVVVSLQEVCGWQALRLERRYPQWTVSYRADHDHDVCARSGRRVGARSAGARTLGNAVVWTGGPDGRPSGAAFTAQRSPGDSTGIACVRWTDQVVHRACSVHLIAPVGGEQIRVRTRQADEVSALAHSWVRRGDVVVLAGDFNASPHRRTLDRLYARGGDGDFREATTDDARRPRCGCYESTLADRDEKIDYVFYSAGALARPADRRLRVVPTASDHRLLVARADVLAAADRDG